jgi:uncharacterized protein YigA (DUF484 family)
VSNHRAELAGVQGITEQDIADYLAHNPAFFERHAELLGSIQLRSPHGNRAVSLQERQMEMLRERIKGLEHKLIEMIRHGQQNVGIADRLHHWTRELLSTTEPQALTDKLVEGLRHQFLIPQAALRLWDMPEATTQALQGQPVSAPISDDVRSLAASLNTPFCGPNHGFEAAAWLEDGHLVQSMAMVPLREGDAVFGLLVLGSPDPTRYAADLGTDFLSRIGETAGAALSRLRRA